MKKTGFTLLVVLGLGSMASPAMAECDANGCSGKVERVYLHNNGYLNIGTDGDENTLAPCEAPNGQYIRLATSSPLFCEYLSMLMAAYLSGKSVRVEAAADGENACAVRYVILL